MYRLNTNLVNLQGFPTGELQGIDDDDVPPPPPFKVPSSRNISSYRNGNTRSSGGRWLTSTIDDIKPYTNKRRTDDAYVPSPKFRRNMTAVEMASRLEQQLLWKMQDIRASTSGRRTQERPQEWKGWVRGEEDTRRIRTESTLNKPNDSSRRKPKVVTTDRRGQPGELMDSLRSMPIKSYTRGLSGAGVKCFRRYLDQGYEPEEARRKVDERKLARERAQQKEERKRGGDRVTPPIKADIKRPKLSTRPNTGLLIKKTTLSARYAGASTNKRAAASSKVLSKAPRNTKAEAIRSTAEETNKEKSSTDALKNMTVGVLPKEYPKITLTMGELAALENSIIEEVAMGCEGTLQFSGIFFRKSLLLIECANEQTTHWLLEAAQKLSSWKGVELMACMENDIPKAYSITISLPKSAGQEQNKTLALIKAQNEGLNTHLWKIVSIRDEKKGQIVSILIDGQSATAIISKDYTLNYRVDKVAVRGLKKYADAITSPQKKPPTDAEDVEVILTADNEMSIVEELETKDSKSINTEGTDVEGLKIVSGASPKVESELPSIGKELESENLATIIVEDDDVEVVEVSSAASSEVKNGLPSVEGKPESKAINEKETDVGKLKVVSEASITAGNGLPSVEKEPEIREHGTLNMEGKTPDQGEDISVNGEKKEISEEGISLASENN